MVLIKQKNFKCPFCSIRSKRNYNITVHIRRKHSKISDRCPDFDSKSNLSFTKKQYFNFPPDFNKLDIKKQKTGFTRFLNFYCTGMLYIYMMSRFQRNFPNFLFLNTYCSKRREPLTQTVPSIDYDPFNIRVDKLFENLEPEIEKLSPLLIPLKNSELYLNSNSTKPMFEINNSKNCNSSIENNYENNKIQDWNEISQAKEFAREFKNMLIEMTEKRASSRQ